MTTNSVKPEPLSDTLQPWERQPNEGDAAWLAFRTYRDLGHGRTFNQVPGLLGREQKYEKTCNVWSYRWSWRIRCHAWDLYVDRREREACVDRAVKKATQRLDCADDLWRTAHKGVKLWDKYLDEFEKREDAAAAQGIPRSKPPITPIEIYRLADTGLKLSLALEGKPSEIAEKRIEATVSERRKTMQTLLGSKQLRDAMRVVSEAVDDNVPTIN